LGFERQQFTFYRSFLNIIEQLPDRKQRDFMLTLIRYALNETEPITKDAAVKAAFEGIRPILDNARNKAQAGKIGGSVSPGNGQLSGKQNASKSKQTQANASRPEANASKRKQDIGEGTGEDTYSDTSIRGEGEEETGSNEDFHAPPEREELYQEIISQLCYYGISVGDNEKADIRALSDQYGGRAILDAIYAADQRNVRRWPYIRAIVTSGGVSHQGGGGVSRRVRESNAQCQRHDDPPSPASLKAAKDMLEWDGESWPPPE
jgi:hypothetical protein